MKALAGSGSPIRAGLALVLLLSLGDAAAFVPKPEAEEPIPPLRPAKAEIPPGFWEQHSTWLAGAGLAVVAVAGFAIWRVTRPRPVPPVPPEAEARGSLKALESQPETGAVLTAATRAVRRYFIRAFDLPTEEPTTAEFSTLLAGSHQLEPELAGRVVDFLRDCDRRKFAPAVPVEPPGAAAGALRLVAQAETRRAALRAAAEKSAQAGTARPPGTPSAPPPAGAGTGSGS